MKSIGSSLNMLLDQGLAFPGLFRDDFSVGYGLRTVKRASARIYVGGGDYYCNIIKDLITAEIEKPLRVRGVAILILDNESLEKFRGTKLDDCTLLDKIIDYGIEIINTNMIIEYHKINNNGNDYISSFYSVIDKISFSEELKTDKGDEALKAVRNTLLAESMKYLAPAYIFKTYKVDVVSVKDVDSKAPLIPINLNDGDTSGNKKFITLSLMMKQGRLKKYPDQSTPHIVDRDGVFQDSCPDN